MVVYQLFDAMYSTAANVVFGHHSDDHHTGTYSKSHLSKSHSNNQRTSHHNNNKKSSKCDNKRSNPTSSFSTSNKSDWLPNTDAGHLPHHTYYHSFNDDLPRPFGTKPDTPPDSPPLTRPPTPPPSLDTDDAYSFSSSPTSSTASSPSSPSDQRDYRYDVVDTILSENNLYKVLTVNKNATHDEIRRAYISKSRICHPDKFPNYAPATEAFQKLSAAYETLSKPSTRRLYDLSGFSQSFPMPNNSAQAASQNNGFPTPGDETLHGVLYQMFLEFMDGDFEMIRVLINALNEGNPGLQIGEETADNVENVFRKIRATLIAGRVYIRVVKFELMRLYEIQHEMRQLSYFDVFGRLRLTIQLARVALELPLAIDRAVQEEREKRAKQLSALGKDRTKNPPQGLLGERVKKLLGGVVGVLERGERFVGVKS